MISEIRRPEIIDLELFPAGIARATSGQVTIAKIVQLNDIDVIANNLSSADIAHLLKTTKVDRILLSSDIEKKSQADILDISRKTVLRFLTVPDGNLGVVVKARGPDNNEGLRVIEVGRNIYNFEVGDTIVSCNDIPLGGLDVNAAISILKTAKDRRLTIMRGVLITDTSNSGVDCRPEVVTTTDGAPMLKADITTKDEGETCDSSTIGEKDWKDIRKDYLLYQASKRLRTRSTDFEPPKQDLEDFVPPTPVCTTYSKELSQSFYLGDTRIFSKAVEKVKREMQL